LDFNPGRPGYAVFAKVVDGMDVVDEIAKVKTGNRGFYENVPAKPVVLEKVMVRPTDAVLGDCSP
jgi:peptidyl-prolyl cis-trans isomerase A (cyclophilin A)